MAKVLVHLLTERRKGHRLEEMEEVLLEHAQVVVDDGAAIDVEGEGVRLPISGQLQPPPFAELLSNTKMVDCFAHGEKKIVPG